MLNKIGQHIETIGQNTLITKSFQRGLQTIESKVAKIGNKVYFKSWRIDEYKHTRKISQAYSNGHPIKGSQSIIDYFA